MRSFYILYPSQSDHFQSRSYDYVFHLSRIVGLAESIEHWDLPPNLNFLFGLGNGYASPHVLWKLAVLSVSHRLYDDQRWKSAYSIFVF